MAFPKFCFGHKSVGYDARCKSILKNLVINYRAIHPVKVQVWAGISIRGRTGVCIFDGIMRAPLYTEMENLFPIVNRFCPDHRYMQDKDPKYTSRLVKAFLTLMMSIGGGCHRNLRKLIQLKIFCMN